VGWSPDGQWLYFASSPYGIGGYILFNGVTNVRRVPVKGGTAQDIMPIQAVMGDVAISPDGKTVAFIQSKFGEDPSNAILYLELQAVASQKNKSFVLPAGYLQAGAIVWSPDSQSLVLCLAVGNYDSEAYTLIQVDASTLAVTTLLTKDNRLLLPVTWPVAGMLWLRDNSDLAWRMEVATGNLTQAGADLTVLSNLWR
jgi:Tol biopolymer transport system component